MALLFMDSCGDHLSTQAEFLMKWDVFNDVERNASGYNSTYGYTGMASAPYYTRVRCCKRVAPNPVNEIVFGFRVKPPAGYFPVGGSGTIVFAAAHYAGASAYHYTNTKQVSINVTTSGAIQVKRGNPATGTVLGTSTATLANDTWTFIEVHVVVHASAGSVTVTQDNVAILSVTGVNTSGMATAAIDGVEVMPGGSWLVDDVYICDRTAVSGNPYVYFFGKGFHVVANRMSANSAVQWTPASGTNVEAIDDATPDTVTTSAAFVNLVDLFTPTALDAAVAKIYAVQSNLIGKKTSSAASPTVADVCQVDGADYVGPAQALQTAWADLRTMRASNPADASEWTRAVYNASLRGYKRNA